MIKVLRELIIETETSTAPAREAKIDAFGRSYATGKRKNSAARVWIKKGTGKFNVNGKGLESYFGRQILAVIVKQPLSLTKNDNKFDVEATIKGGGLSGQAGALMHGISKALVLFDPSLHKILRDNGLMTRDSRMVERKKYGRKKARKGPTYRKR